jgi:hypothetical protein
MSGIRPQLKLGDVFTSCLVLSKDIQVFDLGCEYEVTLRLVFPEHYGHLLNKEIPVELFEGTRPIARGEFLATGWTSTSDEQPID